MSNQNVGGGGGGGGGVNQYSEQENIIKRAAGMHHTPPRLIFDTKTIHKSRTITRMKKKCSR